MKTKKISATDISRFHGDQQLNKDGRMVGTYQQENGFYTRYSLNQQEAIASYLVRGSVSLFDPKTGQVLKVKDRSDTKADYLTQNQDVYKDARLSIMLNSNQAEDLRQAIAEKSQALCSKHMSLLLDSTAKSVPSEQMTLLVAIALFGNQYVQSRSKSAEAQHTRMLRLDRVANLIPQQKLGSLSLRVVKKACQELGDQWRKYVQEASSFVDYIFHLRRDASGHNAFQDYLERHPKEVKRNHQKAAKKAVNSDILSLEKEQKLNELISNNICNGCLIGILLVKEAGFSAAEACALTWKDVLPIKSIPDALWISHHHKDSAGATHNYSFPIVGFSVEILRARKSWLLSQGFSVEEIADMRVASSEKNPSIPLEPKDLTFTCRKVLRHFKVDYATLTGLQEYRSGAGITLLLRTYKHRLEDVCGLKNDPAAVTFLQHKSLSNSVQADHYRCFTDATGIYYLTTALRRDTRFIKEHRRVKGLRRDKQEFGEQITVLPKNSHLRTHAEFRLHLEPGQTISISAPHGCIAAVTNLTKS